MHTDKRIADVDSGIGFYMLRNGGLFEYAVRGRCKRAARVNPRNDGNPLIIVFFQTGFFDDERTVQMFAALRGDEYAERPDDIVYRFKNFPPSLFA